MSFNMVIECVIKKSVEIINPQSLSHFGTNRKLSFSALRSWAQNLLRFTMDPPNR